MSKLRGFGEEEVGDDEKLEGCQPFAYRPDVRRGHREIRSHHQHRTHATRSPDRGQQLVRGLPNTGNRRGRETPHISDVCPGALVVDASIPRQLISLLSMLAAPL